MSFALIVQTCVRICTQNYIPGAIDNSIGGVCSALIEYLIYCLVGALRCVAAACWDPMSLIPTSNLFSTDRSKYKSAPTMPWTRFVPWLSRGVLVSSSGVNCSFAPYIASRCLCGERCGLLGQGCPYLRSTLVMYPSMEMC